MKTFYHKLGHVAGCTMTVSELKDVLDRYPGDMPVFGDWEGVSGYVQEENISVDETHKGSENEKCECLHIWVEKY